jgi:hypothetical protein
MAKNKDQASQIGTQANGNGGQAKPDANGKAEEKPARISVSDACLRVIREMEAGTEADNSTLGQAVKELVEESGGQVTLERAKQDVVAYAWTAVGLGLCEVEESVTVKKIK